MILRAGGYQGVYSMAPLGELSGSIRISVDARQLDSTNVACGFFCRGGSGYPPRPVYTARVDRTGAWMIWRFEVEAPHLPRTLAAGVSPSVRSDGISHLDLDCVGDDASGGPVTLRFFVNGRVLG